MKKVIFGQVGKLKPDMVETYREYLTLKDGNRKRAEETVMEMLADAKLTPERDRDYFLTILSVLSLSSYLKEIGREMLTARYADPALLEQEQQEEADAEKRERKEEKIAAKRERKQEKVAAKQMKKDQKDQEK